MSEQAVTLLHPLKIFNSNSSSGSRKDLRVLEARAAPVLTFLWSTLPLGTPHISVPCCRLLARALITTSMELLLVNIACRIFQSLGWFRSGASPGVSHCSHLRSPAKVQTLEVSVLHSEVRRSTWWLELSVPRRVCGLAIHFGYVSQKVASASAASIEIHWLLDKRCWVRSIATSINIRPWHLKLQCRGNFTRACMCNWQNAE